MENYPSLAEGNGLENRQVGKPARGFESHILLRHRLMIIVYYSGLEQSGSSSGP